MIARLGDIFEIIQGHQITDEEIYRSIGDIPIFTGNNEIKGYWNHSLVTDAMLPCLTYPSKAFAGIVTLQKNIFDANNTAVLHLKTKYKDKVLLEWIKFILPSLFFKHTTSKEGVSYLNKEIVENLYIEIPSIIIQKKQLNLFDRIEFYQSKIKEIEFKINQITNRELLLKKTKTYDFLDIFNPIEKGNYALTDEIIYTSLKNNSKLIPLWGGTQNHNLVSRKIAIDGMTKDGKIINLFNGEGIIISLDGSAGYMTYKNEEEFALNHHAGFITEKRLPVKVVNLKYFSIFYKDFYKNLAVSEGSKTLSLEQIYSTQIQLPHIEEQNEIIIKIEKLLPLIKTMQNIKKIMKDIETRELIYN